VLRGVEGQLREEAPPRRRFNFDLGALGALGALGGAGGNMGDMDNRLLQLLEALEGRLNLQVWGAAGGSGGLLAMACPCWCAAQGGRAAGGSRHRKAGTARQAA
jgi:hypothetical protein